MRPLPGEWKEEKKWGGKEEKRGQVDGKGMGRGCHQIFCFKMSKKIPFKISFKKCSARQSMSSFGAKNSLVNRPALLGGGGHLQFRSAECEAKEGGKKGGNFFCSSKEEEGDGEGGRANPQSALKTSGGTRRGGRFNWGGHWPLASLPFAPSASLSAAAAF